MRVSELPEYGVWAAMKRRCYNPHCDNFKHYGGRGITVCERWRNNFTAFLADMGSRPPGGEIERKNNNLGYGPDNCAWTSHKAQTNNTRRNRRIEFRGVSRTVSEWADATGIPASRLLARIDKLGMSVEDAFTKPERLRGDGSGVAQRTFEHDGQRLTLGEWAKASGIGYTTLWKRLFIHKIPFETAISTEVRSGGSAMRRYGSSGLRRKREQ